jgi:hypothetical protein
MIKPSRVQAEKQQQYPKKTQHPDLVIQLGKIAVTFYL